MGLYRPCKRCSSNMVEYPKLYCETCEPIAEQEEKERLKRRAREYRTNRTDKDYQALYQCDKWRKLRQRILNKQMGLDILGVLITRLIMPEGNDTRLVAHHILPSKEIGKNNFYDENNIIMVSEEYHRLIHLVYDSKNKYKLIELLKELKQLNVSELLSYIINECNKETNEKIDKLRNEIIELFDSVR